MTLGGDPLQKAYDRAVRRFGAIPGVAISVTSSPHTSMVPVVVLKNMAADPTAYKVQIHFHGDQLFDHDVDYETHIGDSVATAWSKDLSTVFVLPEARNEDAAPRSDWANIVSVGGAVRQAVESAGLNWSGVRQTDLSGHSAGGSVVARALVRLAQSDPSEENFNRVELYDAAVGSQHNPVSESDRKLLKSYCAAHQEQFVVVPGIMKSSWLDYIDPKRWTESYKDHWSPLWESLGQYRQPQSNPS